MDYNDQVANFSLGKTAFRHQGNWTMGTLLEIDPGLDMAFLPHLLGNSQEFNSIPVGIPNYWTVNSNKAEAEAFQGGRTVIVAHTRSRSGLTMDALKVFIND